jgi:hypothetical protein
MANLIVSVPTQETAEYDLYLKPYLNDPQIQSLPFDFMVGAFKNRELYFNTQLDKIASKKVACGWNFVGGTNFAKKTLSPVEIEAATEQCYIPLINTIFADGLPTGWQRGELSPEVVSYMADMRGYAFNRDMLTIAFLGDEASSNPYYAIKDGIYKKLKAGSVTPSFTGDDLVVDAGALNATNLNATNFFTTMKAVYDAQPRLLRNVPKANKAWIWTESVYDLYLNYLYVTTQTNAGIIQRESITDGLDAAQFLGIPIVVVPIVDERLEEDFTQSGITEDPYRVILTEPSNHKILMDADGILKTNSWYEKKDDKYYMAGSCLFDYEFGYGALNVIAGF